MAKDYKLERRKYVIAGFIILIVCIYIYRLIGLQLGDNPYKISAESNAFLKRTLYPARGVIYDRNGELVVFNQPAYDLMLIPKDVEGFDTLSLCNTLRITPEQLREKWADMKDTHKNPGYSAYTAQKLISHLSQQDYGRLQEKMYLFPGFYIQKRTIRQYAHHVAANVLGNIREVSAADLERDGYYRSGDYTGDLGVEKSYETYLRGVKGEEILMKDALGRVKGKYEDGRYDVSPRSGRNLTLSIDIESQEYGEALMAGKNGAIVCIEPSTGEILALVTAPSYDPSLLLGRERGKHYAELVKDPRKPLFDRALQAAYPPGSTFKPTQGMILLQEGIITTSTTFPCARGYRNGLTVGCHPHGSPIALKPALQTSCNAFFCWGFKYLIDKPGTTASEQLTKWKNYLVEMGYGYKLGVDLPSESRGFIPNAEYYTDALKKWSGNSIISVSIGQGEVLATPIQIANLAAQIANRGWYYTPHVVKEIQDTVLPSQFRVKHTPHIKKEWYEAVAEGMRMAVLGGTCKKANLPDIEVCGKTGTAQNPHGADHSAFMGFAPYRDPKIAVAVYVENAGYGAAFGVPIGTLMIEKYLKRQIRPSLKGMEEQMMNARVAVKQDKKDTQE